MHHRVSDGVPSRDNGDIATGNIDMSGGTGCAIRYPAGDDIGGAQRRPVSTTDDDITAGVPTVLRVSLCVVSVR